MLDFIEKSFYYLSSYFLEGDVDAHCQLDGPLSETAILTTSDDIMSVIEIRGSRRLMGSSEFETMAENLSTAMSKVMKAANGSQHSFAVGFRSAPGSSNRLLREIMGPNFATSRRFGVSDEVSLSDQAAALALKCKEESIYLVMYTHPAGLSVSDRNRLVEWKTDMTTRMLKAAPGSFSRGDFSQRLGTAPPSLIPRHAAALENLLQDLQNDVEKMGVGILAEVLEIGTALSLMRRHLDGGAFPSSWRPRFIGDRSTVFPTLATREKDGSHFLPMRLSRQMVSEPSAEKFGEVEYTRRGNLYYAGVVLEVPPSEGSLPFSILSDRIGRQIPWTMNMEIVPNGTKMRKIDQFYSAVTGSMGDYNKKVKDGWKHLKEIEKNGTYVAAIRVVFLTWAGSEREISDNLSTLKSSLESWGSSTTTNETGNPGLVSMCAAAGFSKRMPAPYIPGPLNEFTRMTPMFPPASVWDSGQLITHTKDGRPYPVGIGSTMQNYWGTLIFAPTGYGKSFLMNMINAGIIFAPGLEDLPYLTVIDVGPSSRLVMDMAKALLPERLARQVVSLRIRNDREYAVNPFDTQLGCDRPTEVDRDFQISVISTICPGLGPEGERFIGQVINEAYKLAGRKSPSQRRWQSSMDDKVAQALEDIKFELSEKTYVWEVVDALFDAGRIDDASLAQRYASPRIPDLIKASRAKEIMDSYGEAPSATRELILDVFTRNIQTAQSEYELISDVTRFEINNARVVSIDLEEVVTGSESEEGKRRAAMMFLFARRLGAKNYFLRWTEIESLVPQRYQAYQQKRVKGLEESMKFLEYDEVHYASGIPSMSKRIQEDLRVGRKYKCVTTMASQLLSDFPRAAVDNCYTYFILGAGTDASLGELQSTFGLSPSETQAIKTECNGPGRLFGLFKTIKGTTSQVLHTTAGPFARWAYSTSKDDALLRAELTTLMGNDYLAALKLLARVYPSGTARDAMERYRNSRSDVATGESIITTFAKMLIKKDV
jgi:intracellular multiplication protein IcmB